MTEQPRRDEPDRDDEPKRDDEESSGVGHTRERGRRIPGPDHQARERGKRYMSEDDWPDAPLKVTVSDGDVARRYAPADLIAKIANGVSATLQAFGGGFRPMLYAVAPGASMTLVFGDPEPAEPQATLPVEITLSEAKRVWELIELEEDDLFERALLVGAPMREYSELAQIVQNESVSLRWQVRGETPRVLSWDRAARQHTRLSARPITQDRPLPVNGVLYRVITESTREGYVGSVGIRLHQWSARPPRADRKQRIIAFYESHLVEEIIKSNGLIGEPVEATLLIRYPVPGTSIDPERFVLVVSSIGSGPPESRAEPTIFDDADFEDQ